MPLSTRQYLNKLNREVNKLQDAVLPVEYKWQTVQYDGYFGDGTYHNTIDSSYECHPMLHLISQGDGGHQRIGDNIKLQNVTVRGAIYFPVEGIGGSQSPTLWQATCRLVFFIASTYDTNAKFTNFATGGTYQQFYDITAEDNLVPAGPFASKNDETRFTTKIVKELVCSVNQYNPTYHFDFNLPLNMHVHYPDFGLNNNEPVNNALLFSVVSDKPAGGGGTQLDRCPIINMYYRLSWTDA